MLTKNSYLIIALCLFTLSGQILGASSSSSSSHRTYSTARRKTTPAASLSSSSSSSSSTNSSSSTFSSSSSSTPINPLANLTKTITQALPLTHNGAIPGLAQLIAAYVPNRFHIAADIQQWIEHIRKSGLNNFIYNYPEYEDIPVSIREPSSPDGRFPIAGLDSYYDEDDNQSKLIIHLFNTKYSSDVKIFVSEGCSDDIEMDKPCYLTYYFDTETQTLKESPHCEPFGNIDNTATINPTGTTFVTYLGDTSLQIPTERPQIAIPQADGSILHVWVPDHNPVTGGTQIEYYLETPISCSSN